MSDATPTLDPAVRIADWIESTRTAGGYGGPVAHWWRDCMVDCRAGHDWRYEGIICGYLGLRARTGDDRWLGRARRAGDDLIDAQGQHGTFSRSAFELNPRSGGTPHEAAASIGLLRLALAIRQPDPVGASRYLGAAERCLVVAHIERLWDSAVRSFRDVAGRPSFVPNKACTLVEALLLLAQATGETRYVEEYALPTADEVLRHQRRGRADPLDGAVAQNSLDGVVVRKYFPYYAARCIPALLDLASATGDGRYLDAAVAAGRFVARAQAPDGGFPQVLYELGEVNEHPRWVAALGDVLRAMALLEPYDVEWDPDPTEARLVDALYPNGAMPTASGFAHQGSRRDGQLVEFRDLLPVVGWADKAFRYFGDRAKELHSADAVETEVRRSCVFRGRRGVFVMDARGVRLESAGRVVYWWRYGQGWAEAEPWVIVR